MYIYINIFFGEYNNDNIYYYWIQSSKFINTFKKDGFEYIKTNNKEFYYKNSNITIPNTSPVYNIQRCVFLNTQLYNINEKYLDNFDLANSLFFNCTIDFEKIGTIYCNNKNYRQNKYKNIRLYNSHFINVNTNDLIDIINKYKYDDAHSKKIHSKVFYKNIDITNNKRFILNVFRNNGIKISGDVSCFIV